MFNTDGQKDLKLFKHQFIDTKLPSNLTEEVFKQIGKRMEIEMQKILEHQKIHAEEIN